MTDLGRSMLPLLKQSFDCALAAKAEAQKYGRGECIPLHLGLSATIEMSLVLPGLQELSRAMPGLELHLVRKGADEVMQLLEDGDIELCLTAIDEIVWDRIDRWPLFTEEFVLVTGAGHALVEEPEVTLGKLAGQKLIARPYCEKAGALMSALEAQHVAANFWLELSSEEDFTAAVGKGMGVGIAPTSNPMPESVVAIPLKDTDLSRTVSLFAVAGRRHSPASLALIRLFRSADWGDRRQ